MSALSEGVLGRARSNANRNGNPPRPGRWFVSGMFQFNAGNKVRSI